MDKTLKESYKEFRTKVRLMREAQKGYFRSRLPLDLEEAKRLEREVDAMLEKRIEECNQ